jgi:heavy metal translocating P-type ATPase
LVVLGGSILLLGFALRIMNPDLAPLAELLDATSAALVGLPIFARAAVALTKPDLEGISDQLVAVALLAAWAAGNLTAAALVPMAMVLGHVVAERSVLGTREAIAALTNLTKTTAQRLNPATGSTKAVEAADLLPGDRIIISPGDRVPTDGVVDTGTSTLDTAPVTGESLPRDVSPGEAVFAGSLNQQGRLEVVVSSKVEDSALGRIARLMDDADRVKPPAVQLLERYGALYLPTVLAIAAITLFTTNSVTAAMAVLIASCPCALAISAPAVAVAIIARASREGILLKGTAFVERLAACTSVVFDKTGTVTHGQLSIAGWRPAEGVAEDELRQVAAALGNASHHPASRAAADPTVPVAEEVTEHAGLGVEGMINGRRAVMGKVGLLEQAEVTGFTPCTDHHGPLAAVALDGRFLGHALFADSLRPESKDVIEHLRHIGIKHAVLLTGDRRSEAERIGAMIGVDQVYAEELPEGKLARVRQEFDRGALPVVVGDGINDALALRAGAVGVAVGGASSDIAAASADVVLTHGDLRGLSTAVDLSRAARRTIHGNIALAFFWIVVGVALSAIGAINPVAIAILHSMGSVFVIMHSGLLLRRKPEEIAEAQKQTQQQSSPPPTPPAAGLSPA